MARPTATPEHTEEPVPRPTTVNVEVDQHNRARAAVRLVRSGTGRHYTLAQFVQEALADKLAAVAEEFNGGEEILPDPAPLETGRAV